MFWSDILLLSAAGGVPTYQPYTGTHAATNQKNGAFSLFCMFYMTMAA